MPNRYIRESAIESEGVNSLSWQAEVFYRRLLNRVDDFGRFTASVKLLRASLFPLQLEKVSEKDIEKLLKEAAKAGLLATYIVDNKPLLALAKWEQGRAKVSKYPPPPADICKHLQTYAYKRSHPSSDAPDSDSDSDSDSDPDSDNKQPAAAGEWELLHSVDLPESLRTPECLKAARDWLEYKAERGQRYKPRGMAGAATTWAKTFTPETFPAAVEHSIANNWAGLFPANANKPNPNGAKQPHRDDNIIGADAVYRRSEELAAHWKAVADSGETPF